MEFTYDRMMFFIETHRRNGDKGTKIHQLLSEAWPDNTVSLRQVQRLMSELETGEREFCHKKKDSRPKSNVRENSVQLVENLITEDSTLSERRIANILKLNDTMVHRILTED